MYSTLYLSKKCSPHWRFIMQRKYNVEGRPIHIPFRTVMTRKVIRRFDVIIGILQEILRFIVFVEVVFNEEEWNGCEINWSQPPICIWWCYRDEKTFSVNPRTLRVCLLPLSLFLILKNILRQDLHSIMYLSCWNTCGFPEHPIIM